MLIQDLGAEDPVTALKNWKMNWALTGIFASGFLLGYLLRKYTGK